MCLRGVSPAAFPPADYEGLIVGAEDLPPLLTPTMLMDLDGYAAWERHMVRRCTADAPPEAVLATLESDARTLRGWKPGRTTLVDAVADLAAPLVEAAAPASLERSLAMYLDVMSAVPDDLRPEPDESGLEEVYRDHVRPRPQRARLRDRQRHPAGVVRRLARRRLRRRRDPARDGAAVRMAQPEIRFCRLQ